MKTRSPITRRHFAGLCAGGLATAAALRPARASDYTEITWDDLIPPGIPYSEIIGEGELDEFNDTWNPIFDANGFKFNEALDGAPIRMPGYVIPLETEGDGVREFLLVPYVGACIHVPPPPPNQLVYVTSNRPWPIDQIWDAVWVMGTMRTKLQSTTLGDIGYELTAEEMEIYVWE